MNDIINLISSLGFPIASCVFLAWYVSTTLKEFQHIIIDNSKALQELVFTIKDLKEEISYGRHDDKTGN